MFNLLSSLTFVSILFVNCLSIHLNENNWSTACLFHGNDLSHVQISSELCSGKCAETNGCTHFTWDEDDGGTCWMKKGDVFMNDAITVNNGAVICGIIKSDKNYPTHESSQGAGITGRYWDCCKPTCSLPGKVSESNSYVRSCRKDGYSVIDNGNADSGCNGGEAFICNNQKPWAVNDTLAYGFADVSIPGLTEQDSCCSCYKLVFTSGSIQGKTMIVQITNSGPNVSPQQFELQIPGGGVRGLFNGCRPQWNSPDNGWGQIFGGVGSRQECDSLPQSIRDGCLFRFDWFKDAYNPDVTYSKVKCPAELVAISGCSH